MPIPKEILDLERPKNTIVRKTAKPNVFMVLQRVGCRYENGKRKPVNGKVIGHLIDGVYVPNEEKHDLSLVGATQLKYGNVAFANRFGSDILLELRKVFSEKDSMKIYVLSLIRASFPGIKDSAIESHYLKSWASVLFPHLNLRKEEVSREFTLLGANYSKMVDFMNERVKQVVKDGTKIIIDGMLKTDDSRGNSYSGFSFKGRIKGMADISILVAVDAKQKEPLCEKVYKGNLPDFKNCSDFMNEFNLSGGILIGDKAFSIEKAETDDESEKKIGYIHPCKRSSKKAKELGLYDGMCAMKGTDGYILGKKGNEGDVYYYAFRDQDRANKEARDFIRREKRGKKGYTPEKWDENSGLFGTIVLVINVDTTLEEIYGFYKLRWDIEVIFKSFKNFMDVKTTREHDDWSVLGSEFVNYIACILTCRMKNEIEKKGLFEKMTYNDILEDLTDVFMTKSTGKEWQMTTLSVADKELLEHLIDPNYTPEPERRKTHKKKNVGKTETIPEVSES